MRIGLFANYRRDENTLAVLRLANLALKLGYDVNLLSPSTPAKRVHAFWDTRAVSVTKYMLPIYRWASGCQHIVWFEHDDHLRSVTQVVSESKHWFVPAWHSLHSETAYDLSDYTAVVAPAERTYECLLRKLPVAASPRQLNWVNWDSGLFEVNDSARADKPSVLKLVVIVESHTSELSGGLVLFVLQCLLRLVPHLHITVSCQSRGGRWFVQQLIKLKSQYQHRLAVRFKDGFEARMLLFRSHDWTWLPGTHSNFGQYAAQSLVCRTPVICYDICPFNELVGDKDTGVLIPCDYLEHAFEADLAATTAENTAMVLLGALTDNHLLSRCRTRILREPVPSRFELFWESKWSV